MADRPFNDASYAQYLREGKLMGTRCRKCGARSLPPRPFCPACRGTGLDWVPFQGRGRLAAFSSISVAPPVMAREGYDRKNPYVVGVVQLDEGVRLVARIRGVDARRPAEIEVGTRLAAEFPGQGEEGQKGVLAFRAVESPAEFNSR